MSSFHHTSSAKRTLSLPTNFWNVLHEPHAWLWCMLRACARRWLQRATVSDSLSLCHDQCHSFLQFLQQSASAVFRRHHVARMSSTNCFRSRACYIEHVATDRPRRAGQTGSCPDRMISGPPQGSDQLVDLHSCSIATMAVWAWTYSWQRHVDLQNLGLGHSRWMSPSASTATPKRPKRFNSLSRSGSPFDRSGFDVDLANFMEHGQGVAVCRRISPIAWWKDADRPVQHAAAASCPTKERGRLYHPHRKIPFRQSYSLFSICTSARLPISAEQESTLPAYYTAAARTGRSSRKVPTACRSRSVEKRAVLTKKKE